MEEVDSMQARRAARRAAMPHTTAFVEQYAEFAPVLIYAIEGGHSYGKPPQDAEVFPIPPSYRMATHVEKAKR